MLAATKCKVVKMSAMCAGEKEVSKDSYDISSIKRETSCKQEVQFLKVSRCSRAKQRQRNVQKSVFCTCKVAC